MIAFHPHQDRGDVIFLTPVERYRASTSTSVMIPHLVSQMSHILTAIHVT